jgi:signal transduction histidine kinase
VHRHPDGSDLSEEAPTSRALDETAEALGVEGLLASSQRRLVADMWEASPSDATHDGVDHARMRELGFRAYMSVPIVARGQVLGTIVFVTAESARRYRSIDVRLAEDLAWRVSAAVESAQLYAVAQRERAQLEEANRAKDEFLAVLSHELRTPLNSMLGWTQIIRAGGLDEKTLARAMDTIERNARAQAQLIADLLDVSRIVTGKLSIDMRPVTIGAIVEQAIEAARPAATAKELHLVAEVALRDGALVGDPDRLLQVVNNLLSNAIKFTPAHGEVVVSLTRDGAFAKLQLKDSGQGIAPEFLPHVFVRFRQGEGATTRAHAAM